ncbi:hypothetical protein [Calothrix sp. NIES-3974]|uniref:hypothetical protein n=1 Tax=Calothrix sp. NIES-3974 TaxID=2005462 RepID=UPI000B5E859D|nr:hypothetical protein NIES3974_08210 [Calothrix sp. NIES-3974]
MLRQQVPSIQPEVNGINPHQSNFADELPSNETMQLGGGNIQAELNRLEEMILNGFRIPLTRRTIVDEEKLLEILDYIRLSLPDAFNEALSIIQQKQEILLEAEEYGQQIIDAAQAKRSQILNDSDIIRQAQREAEQMHLRVQQECETMMQDTLEEIENLRRQCQQELEQMRQNAIAQAEEIEKGADEYADSVLENIEEDLTEMLRVIRNGRQQLYPHQNQSGKIKK